MHDIMLQATQNSFGQKLRFWYFEKLIWFCRLNSILIAFHLLQIPPTYFSIKAQFHYNVAIPKLSTSYQQTPVNTLQLCKHQHCYFEQNPLIQIAVRSECSTLISISPLSVLHYQFVTFSSHTVHRGICSKTKTCVCTKYVLPAGTSTTVGGDVLHSAACRLPQLTPGVLYLLQQV